MTGDELFKMKDAVRKYYINNQFNGKVSLTFDEFYAWVKFGYAVGVNRTCMEKNIKLKQAKEKEVQK